jgi:hypothetical protein
MYATVPKAPGNQSMASSAVAIQTLRYTSNTPPARICISIHAVDNSDQAPSWAQ